LTDTQRRPPKCHFDRTLGIRVTREHRDDCPNPSDHGGCAPCTAPHCVVCGRGHVNNTHPITCEGCVITFRQDLDDIQAAYTALSTEALEAGADGRLVAAAPIPGGKAAVLVGPMVRLDMLRTAPGYGPSEMAKVHRPGDPIPPLAVLAQWEDMWRQWAHHARGRRATIGAALSYLRDQAEVMAQSTDGPDWLACTRQVRDLRADLERALHDEREPEIGVDCFECGDRLVRRFRARKFCQHTTAARRELRRQLLDRKAHGRRLPSNELVQRAKQPCLKCNQGGLDDPAAGQSWECPGCRKQYDPGEYATAVRRSLLDGDGWTTIMNASAAAATLTGAMVGDKTIRSWVQRGWVDSYLTVQGNGLPGLRLVFWPDVKREALRLAAGLQHCKHLTPARRWLRVLESYPELEVWEEELEAAKEECGMCALAVREVRGQAGAVTVA
jgi:hypothetical protein